MKKRIIFIGLLLVTLVTMSFLATRIYAYSNLKSSNDFYTRSLYGNESNYEFVLMHLSQEERDQIELRFIEKILIIDTDQMTQDEILTKIESIKNSLIINVEHEQRNVEYFGMMRGNRYQNDSHCYYEENLSSYEGFYSHSSESVKNEMDLKLVELIHQFDFDNLTEEEQIERLNDIKVQTLDYVIN